MNVFEHRSFGHHLKLSVRGTSHAPTMSFRLEGLPADFAADHAKLAKFMARRAPGRDELSTARQEDDEVVLTRRGSVLEGVIRNTDTRPADYGAARTVPRPGHADFGQWIEYGRLPTGGGINSGRMTALLCAAGGICRQWLSLRGVSITAAPIRIGPVKDPKKFEEAIRAAKKDGDSVGGEIRCTVTGVMPGVGGALFAGLESELSAALFAIPGVNGVAFGNGFAAARKRGSENNDAFCVEDGRVCTTTNRQGGILGGRTLGLPIDFTVSMKPTPTIFTSQDSVDLATLKPAKLEMKGRHDPCIVLRALPVVEAMAAFAIADAILADEAARPRICLTLTGETIEEDLEQYRSQRYFIDMVEVRVDLLTEAARRDVYRLLEQIDVPAIVTLRRKCDGGKFSQFDGREYRTRFFRNFLFDREPGCGKPLYVDFEDDRRSQFERFVLKRGARIVRSHHYFDGKPKDIVTLLRNMKADTNDIPKIAFKPKNLDEVSAAYAEVKDFHEFPYVLCIMGPLGLVSRACACRFGSAWTYASVGGLEEIGHLTPQELVRTYRVRSQTRDWALYGVTGWPLAATRSPEINNLAWADADEDKVMIPFPAKTAKEAVRFCRAMGMCGMAVTIPHKQTIIPLLDGVGEPAKRIGAVNTVIAAGDRLTGENSDGIGFGRAIRHFVGRDDFSGMSVAVLGAGGASKAVVSALEGLGARVKVFHRSTPRRSYDLVVNATPVDPIPRYRFTGREMVYDLVYVPDVTPLMARAKAAGCRVENGFSMLREQAEVQRTLWSES